MKEDILKLTNIAYKLLEFFPEAGPLKNRAKDKALEIMSEPDPENIDILLGYFWIAKCQGWISSTNYLIIVNEYEKISDKRLVKHFDGPATIPATRDLGGKEFLGRKGKIISFLENNEKAQVMDLQKVLPNITKRTIRRDLDELLGAGKVARFGEFNQVFYKIRG